jgi:adenylate cyclase class IV
VHLDEVAGLGPFIELESVLSAAVAEELARTNLEELIDLLALPRPEGLAGSYADLLGL